MTTFDNRKDAAECKYAHDAELLFKANARRDKLLGHFEGNQPATRKPGQKVGSMRLYRSNFGKIVSGGVFEGFVWSLLPVEATRLKAINRPVLPDLNGKVTEVEDVAEHASTDEQRRGMRLLAGVHLDQMRRAFRRRSGGGLRP